MDTKTTKKELMYKRIEKHGQDLNRIFNTGIEPVALCKKVMRIERKAYEGTLCLCNTNTLHLRELNQFTGYDVKQATEKEQDAYFDKVWLSLEKVIGKKCREVCFINFDPRGYALKIKDEYVREHDLQIHKDWGGYGIIAPDLS